MNKIISYIKTLHAMTKWPIVGLTIVLSIIFFAILVLVGMLANKMPAIEPVHVFLSLIPFIILLIVSGQLKELRGPGGIGLILREQVENKISTEYEDKPLEVEEGVDYEKGGMMALHNVIATNPPTSMSFIISKTNYYNDAVIQNQVEQLLKYPEFRYIVFTDSNKNFLGAMDAREFMMMIRSRRNIVEELESGFILEHPNVLRAKVDKSSTNRKALSIMEASNINKLAVVDADHRFIGVVTQDEIVRRILARVIKEA